MRLATWFVIAITLISCKKQVNTRINAQDLLIAGKKCVRNSDCPTGLCRFDMCTGLLVASRAVDRLRMARQVRALCKADPRLRRELLEQAGSFFKVPQSDPVVRGRAAQVVGMVCRGRECDVLRRCVKRQKDPLRFACAIGLSMAGDPMARRILAGYTHLSARTGKLARFFMDDKWKNL